MYSLYLIFLYIDQFPSSECKDVPRGEYLFNIKDDPYETTNVVDKYPEVAKQMREKVKKYRDEAAPENPHKKDPASDPSNFDGAWSPWGGV